MVGRGILSEDSAAILRGDFLPDGTKLGGADLTERRKRTYERRPMVNPADVELFLNAAKALSNEHWEIVEILYETGISVQGLSSVTWRDYIQGNLLWKRRGQKRPTVFRVETDDLDRAIRGYIARPRHKRFYLDRLFREVRAAVLRDDLAFVTPMTLRLTRCWLMLRAGTNPLMVEEQLGMDAALVDAMARFEPSAPSEDAPASGEPDDAEESRRWETAERSLDGPNTLPFGQGRWGKPRNPAA